MNSSTCHLDKEPFIVLSDIHADPYAMEAVLRAADDRSRVKYRCFLGDAIGYGYDPNTVLDRLAEFDVLIKGNHEMLALGQSNPNWYSQRARESISSHKQRLTTAQQSLVEKFADNFICGNIILFHGHPESPLVYLMTDEEIREVFEKYPQYDLLFSGHVHIPRVAAYEKSSGVMEYLELDLPYKEYSLDTEQYRYLITCPSVMPGRFQSALPGCCRLHHESETRKKLEFIFVER